MKILGLWDVRRAVKAAEPGMRGPTAGNTDISKVNEAALPSKPLKSSMPRADIGDSGTKIMHGIIMEEYNPTLSGVQGINVYDEMRRSDGTVRAACLVTTLPIMRAKWFINPATNSDQDKEIANFVEHALFDWLDLTWDELLRQALLMLPFGVMLFEKVYGVKEHDGKTYVTLEKLAPRLPKSIMQWELPDRTFGIQQITQSGPVAMIPGSKLLIFVNEREGDNWWGTSILRAAYKHWYMKNTFYRIDAIAFERQGIGVPKITMPAGYTESDERKAVQAMQNLRANENAYLLLPQGYEAEFMDMGSTTTRDPSNSINHHNKEILQSVLAQFLELGANKSGSGSRALSEDHSDIFLNAEEAVANTIIGVINKDLIKELVDLNFNDVKVYPALDYSGITRVDVTGLGTAYSQLVTAGALTPTDDDQQYLRAAMGLPPRTQEDIDAEQEGEPTTEEQTDHVDVVTTTTPDPKAPETKKTETTQDKEVDKASAESGKNDVKPNGAQPDPKTKKKVAREVKKFGDKGFMPYRPFTMAEKKVDWNNIGDSMDAMEENLSTYSKELLNQAKDRFMAQVHDALENGDSKAIAALQVGFVNEYEAILTRAMKGAYEYGKSTASREMGIPSPASDAESMANISAMASTIAQKAASDIESKARTAALNATKKDATPLQAAGEIDSTLDDVIAKSIDDTASTIIGQFINNGRNDVFEANPEKIYALQRSEILDSVTCDFCISMDGRVVEKGSDWAKTDTFHTNCRGIWVEILEIEQDPPEITGVPDALANYFGGQTNQLIQPPKPILDKNSPARDEVNRRNEEKKK